MAAVNSWAALLASYGMLVLLLNDTRKRYKQLMSSMRRAENSMEPVLVAFQDQVLVLKHNLNARAIGALASHQVLPSSLLPWKNR